MSCFFLHHSPYVFSSFLFHPHFSPALPSLHNPLTSFINILALTPFSPPLLSLSPSFFFFYPLLLTPRSCFFLFLSPFTLTDSHTFTHGIPPLSVLPRAPLVFRCVDSQVDWPLNIIITDTCMNKYNRLFSFLLQLKHMVWSLREVWFHLKRTGEEEVGRWELSIQAVLPEPAVLRLLAPYAARGTYRRPSVLFTRSTSHSSGTVVRYCAKVGRIVLIRGRLGTDDLDGYAEGEKTKR